MENSLENVSDELIGEIKDNLSKVISNNPLVSIVIPAYNEELNLLKCIDSLSRSKTTIPFEIIVSNNNSNDRTQEVINMLGVRSVFQPTQGWGPARQMGMEAAKGRYILTADADCYYPSEWVQRMSSGLMKDGVSCVYGKYSYIGDEKISRFQFWFYERLTDTMRALRHIKRPYLNSYGMSMGYKRDFAMQVKYVDKKIAGEDGRLCFDLMSFGKVHMIRSSRARVFTAPRAIFRSDQSLASAIVARVIREIARFEEYFKKKEAHDTKTSSNGVHTLDGNMMILKKKLGMRNRKGDKV